MRVFRRKRVAGALGKLPARDFGAANVNLSAVLATALPTAPATFGHASMFKDWGMLGNDAVGDCAFAGSAHETMCFTGIGNYGKLSAGFTTTGVLSDYSALTGYVPGDPSTDVGTDCSQLMDYRRTTGVVDRLGRRHKIDLAVRIPLRGDPWQEFLDAVYCFKAVAVGFEVPSSAMDQFNAGQPWSYTGDQNIEGGHYVPALGSARANECSVVTWGARQRMERDFFEAYVDELWVPLSREAMAPIEAALKAVDWTAVETIAKSL